jgi:hypothetical protein
MDAPTDLNNNLSRRAECAMAVIYLITAGMLFYLLSVVWPSNEKTEARLIWLVVISSALGSYTHTVTSFAIYSGNRRLNASWLAWYLLRPAISAALALIFYFALRAGLFSGATADQTVNPFGVAAISGMVGMFSKQATEKLGKIFDTIFT